MIIPFYELLQSDETITVERYSLVVNTQYVGKITELFELKKNN